jgi:hypothetical protein
VLSIFYTIANFNDTAKTLEKIYKSVIDEINIIIMAGTVDENLYITIHNLFIEQIYDAIFSDPFLYTLICFFKLYPIEPDDLPRQMALKLEKELLQISKNKNLSKLHSLLYNKIDKVAIIYEFSLEYYESKLNITNKSPPPKIIDNTILLDKKEEENKKSKIDELYEFIISDDPEKKINDNRESGLNSKMKKKKKKNKRKNSFSNENNNSGENLDKEVEDFKELLKEETINAKFIIKIKPNLTTNWINNIK